MTGPSWSAPIMQPRCPGCLLEHYGPHVWEISHGSPCPRCGHDTVYERIDDYRAALAAARARRDQIGPDHH